MSKREYFLTTYKAIKRLESFWSANGYQGIASIWTEYGPRFFNMAKTSPSDVVEELKDEFLVTNETVARWIENVSVNELH